jgi:hypothetical protein
MLALGELAVIQALGFLTFSLDCVKKFDDMGIPCYHD